MEENIMEEKGMETRLLWISLFIWLWNICKNILYNYKTKLSLKEIPGQWGVNETKFISLCIQLLAENNFAKPSNCMVHP